jgi:hypothetical protein
MMAVRYRKGLLNKIPITMILRVSLRRYFGFFENKISSNKISIQVTGDSKKNKILERIKNILII